MLVQDLFESVEYIRGFRIHKNPSVAALKGDWEGRGLIDDQGNFYWWDAHNLIHVEVAKELGLRPNAITKLDKWINPASFVIISSSPTTPKSAFKRLERIAERCNIPLENYGHTVDLSKETLKEGRDAPLYHATTFQGCIGILNDGGIEGDYQDKGSSNWGKTVSATRNIRLRYYSDENGLSDHGQAPIQLVLNQRKITQHFKIKPTDFWNGQERKKRSAAHESEEEIITNLLPLEYIDAIMLMPVKTDFADIANQQDQAWLYRGKPRQSIYTAIKRKAKEKGIPVIDKRPKPIREETVSYLPATPENIAKARAFVFKKWVERYDEWYAEVSRYPTTLKRNPPKDLSNSCKFSSMFAQRIFGGKLRGSDIHQYVLLPNRKRLDLNIDAEDVQGFIENGDDPHWHDRKWFGNPDHKESMRSCEPRVNQWVKEFLSENSLQETVLVEGRDAPLYHATDLRSAIHILTDGYISGDHRQHAYTDDQPGRVEVSTSRDRRYRFTRVNGNEKPGFATVQFVIDQNAVSRRFRIRPFDYFQGGGRNPQTSRATESEECIVTKKLPVSFVKKIELYDMNNNPQVKIINPDYAKVIELAKKYNISIIDSRAVAKIKESKETISLKSRFNHNDMELDVFSNPSPAELLGIYKKYGDLRGLIDEKGNFYWWDGNDAIHHTVAGKIGLSYSACSTVEFVIKDHISIIYKNPKTPAAAFTRLEKIAERCGLYVQNVLEESVRRVSVSGYPVVVIENPTREQFAKFAEKHRAIRGLISSDDKNLWIWEAGSAVHTTMMEKLGLNRVDCIAYHDGRWNGPVNDYGDVYRKPLERLTPKPKTKREYDQKEIEQLLKDLEESASGGATGAASVAAAVGGLGAGFDNDYSKSIYGKPKARSKPLVIKRVAEAHLDEITLIPDFDDKLNADRRENRESNWAVPKTAKKVGRIGEFNLYKDTQYGVDTYYLLDSKKFPMGKANVFQTDARFGGYYKVSHIWFDPTIRRKGYGIKFYEFLLNSGLTLVSDEDQTRYSKSIWLRLAQKYTVRPFDKFSGKLYAPIKDTSEIYGTSELLIATKKPMKESHKIDEINIVGDFDDDILSDDSTYREIMWALPSGAKKVGQIGDLDIFKDSDHYFIVDDAKKTMGKATIAKVVGGYKVSNILFDPSIRGKGYGFKFYEYLLDKGISIISDKNQTRFSQKIWQKLAKKYTVRPFINGRKGDPVDDLSKFYDHSNKTVLLIASKNSQVVKESEKISFLYHGTSKSNLQSIIRNGLTPYPPSGGDPWPEYDEDDDDEMPDEAFEARVFATQSRSQAKQYAENYQDPIILRINEDDNNWNIGETDFPYYYTTEIVLPSSLQVFTKDGWKPLINLR